MDQYREHDQFKFVVMDFEFSMMNRDSIVLVSGALSNCHNQFSVQRVQGYPLLLPKQGNVEYMNTEMISEAINSCTKYLRNKPEILNPLLKQFRDTVSAEHKNLNVRTIRSYLDHGPKVPVVVFWNGSSDREILKRMGLGNYKMLELVAYDVKKDQVFFLQLKNMHTKQVICSEEIGYVEKKGTLLNLGETHKLLCSKTHEVTQLHDPRTDVIYTECLFENIYRTVRRMGLNLENFI